MPPEIVLQLTPQEVDQVCNALAQRPWVEVNNLLQKIVTQGNAQRQQSQGVGLEPAIGAG